MLVQLLSFKKKVASLEEDEELTGFKALWLGTNVAFLTVS